MDSPQTLVQHGIPRAGEPPRGQPAQAVAGGAAGLLPRARAPDSPPDSTTGTACTPLRPRSPSAAKRPREDSLLHGRYRLIERLGAGGFGVVWRAQDELLHREVALKRIPLLPQAPAPDGREDEPQAGERASREALACARLAHPAIVALYEAYVDDDAFYLVSELIHGDTLARLIAARELSDEELLQIGVDLAQALAHAHARGVIHRDVKPQNVLVPHDPGPHETLAKLTDFGGASLSDGDALTRTGETLGTLAYMAPEQSEGREVGEPADLYSLALVLYEGLTGVNPVRAGTPAATARRIGRPLPPLSCSRPDLPRPLTRALDTALAIDPLRRGTLQELGAVLEQALARGLTRRRSLLPRPGTAPPGPREQGTDPDERLRPREVGSPQDAAPAATRRRLPVPRAVWLGCVFAAAVWQVASGRPGVALLLASVAAPLLLIGSRPGLGWLAGALAPLLGVAGLAGAYPALAGQASRWSERAALGALGYVWLILAEPLLAGGGGAAGARLWLGPPAGMPARAVWEGSLPSAATHVVGPSLSAGLLFGAILWAVGAALLPWIVRGRGAALDTLAAVAWSAALLAATPYFDAGLSTAGTTTLAQPRGAVLGAVLAAAIAIAASALRGPVAARHP